MAYYLCRMRIILLLLSICLATLAKGQNPVKDPVVKVHSIDAESITVDGQLTETVWSEVLPAKNFRQFFPTDSILALAKTEIYLLADEQKLYVGIKCYSSGNKWVVPSLKRDYRAGGSDNLTLVFDSFDDRTNAIFFGVNPEGVIREGLISNGGNRMEDFSESWDNKWTGNAHKYDGYYTAELAIPFSTLRYNADNKNWGLMAYRFDTQGNEISTWPGTPQNQVLFNLAIMGDMQWEVAPAKGKKQVSIIPFISAGLSKDFEGITPTDKFIDAGGDAKIAITSGLNLDLTVNPDFSQVEVDEQITNLDRFELFFQERRQFFLENADLFGQFGFGTINPFFSRRIGLGIDTKTGSRIQNRIYGGVRLSGKLNQKLRVGLLNMHTHENLDQGVPSTNYTVLALQQKVLSRSNISFIGVNKNSAIGNFENTDVSKYNRVFGVDFNYANQDNSWSGKTFTHTAVVENQGAKLSHGTLINYNKRAIGVSWEHAYVQKDYSAEVGFIRRTNYINIAPSAELRFYPAGAKLNTIAIGGESDIFWKPGFGKTDHDIGIGSEIGFTNNTQLEFFFNHSFVHLFDDFDPTGTDSAPLFGGTAYNYWSIGGSYESDRNKKLSYQFSPYVGQYFNGNRYGTSGSVTFRYEPKGSVQLNYAVNYFDMPHLEEVKSTLLIGPRIDYTFSKSVFSTLFVQYNSQSQNTNVNARLQWRFAPVSDFFLVYTDNYFSGLDPADRFTLDVRNRSLVAKLTYWFNA